MGNITVATSVFYIVHVLITNQSGHITKLVKRATDPIWIVICTANIWTACGETLNCSIHYDMIPSLVVVRISPGGAGHPSSLP